MGREQGPGRTPAGQDIVPSMEAILAAGRAKANERAREYRTEVERAKEIVGQATELSALGVFSPKEFAALTQNYQRLLALPNENPALKKALERIIAEEAKPSQVVQAPKAVEAPKQIEAKEPAKKDVSSKESVLAKVSKFPKMREFLSELFKTTPKKAKTAPDLYRKLWKGIKNKERKDRFDHLMSRARKELKDTDFEIVNLNPRGSNKGARYYLKRIGEEVSVLEPVVRPEKTKKIREPRGETVVLPDGQKVTGLGKIAKETLEGLLVASSEHPITFSELSKVLYGDDKKENAENARGRVQDLKPKLDKLGWVVVNLTSVTERFKGKESQLYLALKEAVVPVERKKEASKAEIKPKGEIVELPDGQKFQVFRESQKEAAELILKSSIENPVSAVELAKILYGEETPEAIIKIKDVVSRIRLRLQKQGWTIANLTTAAEQIKGERALYYLVRADKVKEKSEPKVAVSKTKVRETKEKKRVSEVLELPDGKSVVLGKLQKKLIQSLLSASSENPVSISRLAEIIYGEATIKNEDMVMAIIGSLRAKLDEVGFRVVNANAEKKSSHQRGAYYLESTGEPSRIIERKKFDEIHEFILPNGKKITGKNAKILKVLSAASEQSPVSSIQLGQELYPGMPYPRAKLNLMPSLTGIRHSLKGSGLELIVHLDEETRMAYYFLKKAGEETPGHVVFDSQAHVAPAPSAEPKKNGEIKIVPYAPTKEEMRSEEETKIVEKVISEIIATGGKIQFDELQKQLYSEDRFEIVGGQRWYRIYEAKDLISIFFFGFNKLREESEIPHLRENWSEDEKKLWEKTEILLRRRSGGDMADFKNKVREAIERGERDFYRRFPPERGLKKGLIVLP